ncbi:hypothetical protein Q9Q94_07460 [Uliginosibacterium sp. 31-16]|uniref:hypothetical protein n=1 Tax=Uliginosibacterium sp. 31-16 TaxID=3068315 RepID=UPI00273E379A|nr:hypothetical protein [Uliginosibacterium sp. 31-16]MDP5239362.1 hypothetical protein [Uliginosibacterium sp. 31-16]
MLNTLIRAAAFIAAVVLLLDILLPARVESAQVDRHSSFTQRDINPENGRRLPSSHTDYKLHLTGSQISSCKVGHSVYTRLQDGDTIEVQSSRLFKTCIRVTQGHEILPINKHWRLLEIGGGVLALLVAFGLASLNRFGAVQFGQD